MKNLLFIFCFILSLGLTAQENEVVLHYGETIVLGDREITFQDVSQDSRCPTDVNCVWAGEVKLHLIINEGKFATEDKYNFTAGNAIILWSDENESCTLVAVSPYPKTSAKIPKEAYFLTLQMVSK